MSLFWRQIMNKHHTQSILKLFFLIVIALSSGCGQPTIIDSPTSTSQVIQPKGVMIYSDFESKAIYSFDIQSKEAKRVSNIDLLVDYLVVNNQTIYALAEIQKDGNQTEIFKINLDGSKSEQLTFDGKKFSFTVSPNNLYLIYDLENSLILLNLEQKTSEIIAEKSGYLFTPKSWSPDGGRFIFTQELPSTPFDQVFLYTLKDKNLTELVPGRTGYLSDPSWSSTGKNIALNLTVDSQSNQPGIYILNVENGNIQNIEDNKVGEDFTWSPKGDMILYGIIGSERINLFDLNKGITIVAKENPEFGRSRPFLWSPDGQFIAYFTNPTNRQAILNIDGLKTGEHLEFEIPGNTVSNAYWISQ